MGAFVFLDLVFLHLVQYMTSRSEVHTDSLLENLPQEMASQPRGRSFLSGLRSTIFKLTWSTAQSPTVPRADEMCSEREKYSDTIAIQLEARQVANQRNHHLAKFILPVKIKDLETITATKAREGSEFIHAWSHLVNVLGGMPVYAKVCFYLVSGVLELNKGKSAKRFETRWRAELILKTGKVYLFRVYQLMGDRTAPPRPGFTMKLSCMEGHLSPLRSEIGIDGAYDRLSFFVYVLPQELETNQSELLLTCDQSVQDPMDDRKSLPIPPSLVELRVQWPWRKRIMKWVESPVLILMGASLFVFADVIQQRLASGEIVKYLIQLFGLSLLATGVIIETRPSCGCPSRGSDQRHGVDSAAEDCTD